MLIFVSATNAKVERADKDVAASWQNVMAPPPPADNASNQHRGLIAAPAAPSNSAATTSRTSTAPCLAAGDGLTETDAADLNYILHEVHDSINGGVAMEKTNPSHISLGSGGPGKGGTEGARKVVVDEKHIPQASLGRAGSLDRGSSECAGAVLSVRNVFSTSSTTTDGMQSSVSGESRRAFHQGPVVSGSSPLMVEPGPAARKALRTLRMYVHRLRVTKDHDDNAVQ